MDEQARKKELAAKAAVDYVIENEYLGVGTGTTVSFFIAALQQSGKKLKPVFPVQMQLQDSC